MKRFWKEMHCEPLLAIRIACKPLGNGRIKRPLPSASQSGSYCFYGAYTDHRPKAKGLERKPPQVNKQMEPDAGYYPA